MRFPQAAYQMYKAEPTTPAQRRALRTASVAVVFIEVLAILTGSWWLIVCAGAGIAVLTWLCVLDLAKSRSGT